MTLAGSFTVHAKGASLPKHKSLVSFDIAFEITHVFRPPARPLRPLPLSTFPVDTFNNCLFLRSHRSDTIVAKRSFHSPTEAAFQAFSAECERHLGLSGATRISPRKKVQRQLKNTVSPLPPCLCNPFLECPPSRCALRVPFSSPPSLASLF